MVTRLITAAVGIVIALLVFALHNTVVLPIMAGVVAALILVEYLRANDLMRYHLSSIASLLFAFLLPQLQIGMIARYRSMLYVAAISCILFDYIRHKKKMSEKIVFTFLVGILLFPPAIATAVTLNNAHEQHGIAYLTLALGGAWIADSGAYFVGSFFGKAKLCPEISPKKTVAGFIGGIVSNIVFFIVFCAIYGSVMQGKGIAVSVNWFITVLVAMVCAVLGTLGDLAASTLKRQLDIKDYGKLMPGHGGVLDRFDSVLLVLPFFAAFAQATTFFEL
ncbi:MAG: phosphatidate cytidylyltransferase [Oscillospiraceae bacterium]|nr:phosphatidate cytidylyltransferase [Oscillospiraceae bacterium]